MVGTKIKLDFDEWGNSRDEKTLYLGFAWKKTHIVFFDDLMRSVNWNFLILKIYINKQIHLLNWPAETHPKTDLSPENT